MSKFSCIDTRERELIPFLNWPVRTLPVGDIWIGLSGEHVVPGGLVIERKTTDDLEASILDGRYREQRTRLTTYCKERNARPLYIIEGLMDRLWGKLTQETLQKYLNRLALRYGVAVIHTGTISMTAKLCETLASQILADPDVFASTDAAAIPYSSTVTVTKKGNREDPKNFAACALQGCPGISAAAADAILTTFGSLTAVMAAEEVALAAVVVGKRKLGPAVAARLYRLLHA